MFDEKEPEDILGGVEADKPKPVPPTKPSVPPAPAPPPPPPAAKTPPMKAVPEIDAPIPPLKTQQGNLVKYFIVALLVILVLIAAGVISYWLLGRSAQPTVSMIGEEEVQVEDLMDEVMEEEDLSEAEDLMEEPVPEPELDTDRDGISDIDEAELGTSIRIADTDADGLSDYEELNTWKTDPLDPDTDGDSFIDGAEIDAGYDPNGPGQLFELPTE